MQRLNKRITQVRDQSLSPMADIRMYDFIEGQDFPEETKEYFIQRSLIRSLGYFPDLRNPKTFNEKTNWYKLYYRDPVMTRCIDKYLFKDYLREGVGEEYCTPLVGAWDSAQDIDIDALPKSFVLKSNWGSGSRHVKIVRDKNDLNWSQLKLMLNRWVQPWNNVYYHTMDWGY